MKKLTLRGIRLKRILEALPNAPAVIEYYPGAVPGSMLLYWYHFTTHGRRFEVETDDDSIGAHFCIFCVGGFIAVLDARHAHKPDPLR